MTVKKYKNRILASSREDRGEIKMKCKMCGEEFVQVNKNHMYCSNCKAERHRQRNKENYYMERNVDHDKICVVCGKQFVAKSSRQLCCSNACSIINKRNKTVTWSEKNKMKQQTNKVKCKICGREFSTNRVNGTYCSEKCRVIGRNNISREYHREKTKQRANKCKQKIMAQQLSAIQREAEKKGMSYGMYVAMYCNK